MARTTTLRQVRNSELAWDIEDVKGNHNFLALNKRHKRCFLLSNTNCPEFEKLHANEYMEALKDRTVKINVPYLRRWSEEIKVLEQDYGKHKIKAHVAPHTLEVAALWAILTRLESDDKLNPVQKAKLYNGESLPNYGPDTVKEQMDKHPNEGMKKGISARYVQDKISNCLSSSYTYINPFMVMNEIKDGLDNHSLIMSADDLAKYHTCVDLALKELNSILMDEVRKALIGDEKAIIRLCANYIDNLMAYINKSKVKNKLTGRDESPNERLMRSIEEKIDIPNQGVDDFRRMIAAYIGSLANEGKLFKWDSNPELRKALQDRLFDDIKDHIKLSSLDTSSASVVQPDLQEKIDAIKSRMITQYGYIEESARDVLEYVGHLYATNSSEDR